MTQKYRLLVCLIIAICGSQLAAQSMIPGDTTQLVVVLAQDWESGVGQLCLLERTETAWQQCGAAWPVTLGENGLGWGRGLIARPGTVPIKREGDGKAPAGLFTIAARLYGYAERPPAQVTLPYVQLTTSWIGVDDPKSRYYNRVFNQRSVPAPDWDSYEEMRRRDQLYQWVIVIEHNVENTEPGAGSCIFFHLWHGPTTPTAGCTAMSEENMVRLACWLKATSKPLLLQLPVALYQEWRLPPPHLLEK